MSSFENRRKHPDEKKGYLSASIFILTINVYVLRDFIQKPVKSETSVNYELFISFNLNEKNYFKNSYINQRIIICSKNRINKMRANLFIEKSFRKLIQKYVFLIIFNNINKNFVANKYKF